MIVNYCVFALFYKAYPLFSLQDIDVIMEHLRLVYILPFVRLRVSLEILYDS